MPQMAATLGNYMQNPLQSSFFQQMLGMANASSGQQGQTGMANLQRNAIGMGGGSNPYLQSLQAQQGRATSQQMAGNFGGLLQNAVGNQLSATNIARGFSPLQTGQTQQISGLGSWLPQLLGAGLGIGTGLFRGKGGGSPFGAMTGTMGAMNSAMSPMQTPFLQGGFNMPANMTPPNVGGGIPGGFGATPPMFGQS